MMHFKEFKLDDKILQAIEQLGYIEPTEVQQKVIPVALSKQDILVKSKTGSGKTAAFATPLCELVDWEENKPQALVLTPTRELAVQVQEDITNIGRYKRIKGLALYGKSPFAKQKLALKQKTHIVVGTPGRVLDHMEKGTLDVSKIEYLVIDEADEMLNMGFLDQVESIIKLLPKKRTTMLFSATLSQEIKTLSGKYMNDAVSIEIDAGEEDAPKIEHVKYVVKDDQKLAFLEKLTIVENPDSCIIFCRTKERVDQLVDALDQKGYTADKIHGGMMQEDRFEVMDDFRRGEFRYLIATDVAARGIDIEDITHVVHYDVPLEQESYVHRTGRTGRAGRSGKSIMLATPHEDKFVKEIEAFVGFEIPSGSEIKAEAVVQNRAAFDLKMQEQPEFKKSKGEQLNANITKLYFNGGKKKKIRAVDFVGTIAKIEGISADDIGIITIQDNVSYVEILNGKGPLVLKKMRNTTIKGKLLKVHIAHK
ncbi:DEAD/DEAH box helicase [Psychrobacillus sp. Sa2BUA9]|uniref:ATP-dependent RNA helicase DbpA n=1 Tax=Psychrobacillus faecigallinarum TaxID=2762235 RepID=A0ABR8RAH8_9BACI|nr:DEAD/DEAH box helicase [Psychrobacillus faecigallinarum]MBD7944788.1 DEAD/DEAH box helicase [Psychrobacillus faecigallinarum]